ncbi:MAG: hypothetical protein ABI910_10715 [Gemmatimonadota bacterium]
MTATRAVLPNAAIRALLSGVIDYAGLFPPASLDLATVAANYAAYRSSDDGWALGRLVVPAARLEELAGLARAIWQHHPMTQGGSRTPWLISALVGADHGADADRISAFNAAYGAHACVDSVETKGDAPDVIRELGARFAALRQFVEIPLGEELETLLHIIGEIGAFAKVRTGGVRADAIPSTAEVARFLRGCADAGIAFKATAGLHHPMRGEYSLTYEADSPRGTMFGYLNVFVGAVRAREGASLEELCRVLEARRMSAFGRGGLATTDALDVPSRDAIASARASFALSFGSCSFREPLDDLASLFAT